MTQFFKQIFSYNLNSCIMKKTNNISKIFIAIATVTFFVACKKEIDRPQPPAMQNVNSISMAKTPPHFIDWPDSTKAKK